MKPHKLEILPADDIQTVQVSSLAGLIKQQQLKTQVFKDILDINHRTAQRRIREPETMTIKELVSLAEALRIPDHQLLDLIRDEYKSRPANPGTPAQ